MCCTKLLHISNLSTYFHFYLEKNFHVPIMASKALPSVGSPLPDSYHFHNSSSCFHTCCSTPIPGSPSSQGFPLVLAWAVSFFLSWISQYVPLLSHVFTQRSSQEDIPNHAFKIAPFLLYVLHTLIIKPSLNWHFLLLLHINCIRGFNCGILYMHIMCSDHSHPLYYSSLLKKCKI